MAGVTARLGHVLSASLAGTADLGLPAYAANNIENMLSITPGTLTTGQADLLYADTATIAASGTLALDLAGALLTPLGTAFTPAELVAIYVKAAQANVNNVLVGGGATPFVGPIGAAGVYTLKPGQSLLFVDKAGWPVTAATADLLNIVNGAGGSSVTLDIMLIGRSVAA